MATSIAKYTKSFFVKVLVGIIILPFIFWGMGDIFRGGNQNIVATIESEKVNTQEFMSYLSRINLSDKERLDIKKTDLLERILSEYIGRVVMRMEMKQLGITVSDTSLKNILINDRTFFKNEKFSRTVYEKFLLQSSMTAAAFEQNIIEQEKRRKLLSYLSNGIKVNQFLILSEFRKENQIKDIKYINLNKYFNKLIIDNEEIKKVYNQNKDLFIEQYKDLNFVELTPSILTSKIEYDQNFFNKIDEIENKLLDGTSLVQIAENNNLDLRKIKKINNKQIDIKGKKNKNLEKQIFQKVFNLKELNEPELIKIDNKYFLAEITNMEKKSIPIDNSEIQRVVKEQITIQNKLQKSTELLKDIRSGKFNEIEMKNFANKNKLVIQNIIIKGLDENIIFSKDMIKKIFQTEDERIELITNSKLSDVFIVFINNTKYDKLEKDTDKFNKYKSLAKLNFANEIYSSYDKSLNAKYDIELNNKVITRIKNSF